MGKRKNREYSSDSGASSDSEEVLKSKKSKKSSKKSKKNKSKKKKRRHSSSSESSESDAWVEKNVDKEPSPVPPEKVMLPPVERDDWMSSGKFFLPTFSKEKKESKSAVEKAKHLAYDPATSSRELNPYYRTGEGGMPTFQKPKDDYDDYGRNVSRQSSSGGNWRKPKQEAARSRSRSRSRSPVEKPRTMLPARAKTSEAPASSHSDFLTDQQLNEIGAKMIKAELMGNESLAAKLKDKLDRAKAFKDSPQHREEEQVVLSITNAAGTSRPAVESERRPPDKRSKKNKRVETHEDGERTKYYPDDGNYDIKQMVRVTTAHNVIIINKII